MSIVFVWSMCFDFVNMVVIFVDQLYVGVYQIVWFFMVEGDGMVVEGMIDWVFQLDFFFMDYLVFIVVQVDVQQVVVWFFMEEIMENLLVVEWCLVVFGNFNVYQFVVIVVCYSGVIFYLVIVNVINFVFGEGGQVDFQQDMVIFYVIK